MEAFISKLKDNWFLIAFLVGMVLWYGNVNTRLEAVEARQVEQNEVIDEIYQMRTDIEVIRSNVEFIKKEIN